MRYGGEPVASSVALTAPPGCRTKPQSFTMTPRRLAPSPSPATLPRVHLAAAGPRSLLLERVKHVFAQGY